MSDTVKRERKTKEELLKEYQMKLEKENERHKKAVKTLKEKIKKCSQPAKKLTKKQSDTKIVNALVKKYGAEKLAEMCGEDIGNLIADK